jgi:hypothetical protein
MDKVYGDVIHAVRNGNLKLFDESMDKNEAIWIQQGTFLVIERWRTVVLRQLIKKVFLVLNGGNRLTITSVQQALAFAGAEMDEDEVECILANLIAKGLMKGYISHEKRTVVLSKEGPFPSLAAVLSRAEIF